MGQWRAALNWYFAVLVFGSIAATIFITVPLLAAMILIYGIPPPSPSWELMRIIQIAQSVVIATVGGRFALKYFQSKYDVDYSDMQRPLKILAVLVPLSCVLMVLFISIPRYGASLPLLATALLIFGTFTALFLASSFHFARKLKRTTEGA